MTTATFDAMEGFMDILASGIPDPCNRGRKWIYPDRPRDDLGASSFPRISVTQIRGDFTPRGIGHSTTEKDVTFDVSFYAKTNGKYWISSTEYNGTKLTSYMVDQIIGVVENPTYRHYLTSSYNVVWVRPFDARVSEYSQERGLYKGTVLIKCFVEE